MKIEEPPFVNRRSELAIFKQKAAEIVQGKGEDLFFVAPLGMGKTALLKEVKDLLFWGQEGVVPVYFSFSRDYIDLFDFIEEYLVALLSQILLFDQKEKIASGRPVSSSFTGLQREAEHQGKDIIGEIILVQQRAGRNKEDRKGLLNALTAPKRIAQATNRPIWVMVDHVQKVEALRISGKPLAGLWTEGLGSPWAPHLFSGEPPDLLLKTLLPVLGLTKAPVLELAPFPVEEGDQLALVLEKTFKVTVARDLSRAWFLYLEQNPGFFTALIKGVRQENFGLESHRRFAEIYLKSLWQGELGRLLENRLYEGREISPVNGRLVLNILNKLLKSDKGIMSFEDLRDHLDLPAEAVQGMIQILEQSGMVRERFGNIGLENNQVLLDWVEVLVRKYLHQQTPEQVYKELGAGIEKRLSGITDDEGGGSLSSDGKTLQFSLTLPINTETELVAVRALEQIVTYTDLDASSIEKTKLALIEACINAGEHSQSFEKKIRVYFTARPEAIEILVEDRGRAFDPVEVQTRMVRETDPLLRKRGRGLSLIKEMMDEVRFEKVQIGTRLTMIKKINPMKKA